MLDILFPDVCPACAINSPNNKCLCDGCYDDIKFINSRDFCLLCGVPFGYFSSTPGYHEVQETGREGNLCGKCLNDFYSFSKARSIAIYDGKIRDLIISFKFEGKLGYSKQLIKILESNLPDDLEEFDTVVPVPLHIDKLRLREFNQSVILANSIAKRFGVKCDLFGLKRIRDTIPQLELKSERDRRKNVRGAFLATQKRSYKGKSVLLVDDVFTTGSTSDECSKILLKSGAYKVQVLTLTRAGQHNFI